MGLEVVSVVRRRGGMSLLTGSIFLFFGDFRVIYYTTKFRMLKGPRTVVVSQCQTVIAGVTFGGGVT